MNDISPEGARAQLLASGDPDLIARFLLLEATLDRAHADPGAPSELTPEAREMRDILAGSCAAHTVAPIIAPTAPEGDPFGIFVIF